VAAFETAMASRNRLLAEGRGDPVWLGGIEESMARHAIAATVARAGLVARLNAALAEGVAGAFPAARMTLVCPIAAQLKSQPALAVEDWLRGALAAGRGRDAIAGSALQGAHRADMALADVASGQDAATASTGQQKALLIAVILGHAALLTAARGFGPLLLLDEPAVHLDAERRAALFAALAALPAQAFLTGTDSDTFTPLAGVAGFWRSGGGGLAADPDFPAPAALH
jgi:DNA replication and repair protein RecF